MKNNLLSTIIIAGNESDVIIDCLKSCQFSNEIIVVTNATDDTPIIVKKQFPKVKVVINPQPQNNFDFSQARNLGAKHQHSKWILYLDADERISSSLQAEIIGVISHDRDQITNYDIPRANYFLGKRVRHGGTYPDYVKRLFLASHFTGYVNQLHEQPQVTGKTKTLQNDLQHFTHRDLTSMLQKSNRWTTLEAQLLFQSGHPPVVWWRFIRMISTKFIERFIAQQMWRDGLVGLISSIFESFDTFMIYAKLWELQQSQNKV